MMQAQYSINLKLVFASNFETDKLWKILIKSIQRPIFFTYYQDTIFLVKWRAKNFVCRFNFVTKLKTVDTPLIESLGLGNYKKVWPTLSWYSEILLEAIWIILVA